MTTSPMEPTLRLEYALWRSSRYRVVGVDEAGVGSLCGPVVAAAVMVPRYSRKIPGVRDSKLLSLAQREALYPHIVQRASRVGVGAASVAEIERLNILRATHLAMLRAVARVGEFDHVLIDGRPSRDFDELAHTAVIDGDALSYSIACASILAKVTRDRLMRKLASRYPDYGWDQNVGYGTARHLAALRERGLSPFHRRGYAPVRAIADGGQATGSPTVVGAAKAP